MEEWWRQRRVTLAASILVGWRQMRHSWRLLLVVGSGVLVAVLLVLLAPVYTYQELQAGLNMTLARGNTYSLNANQNLALAMSTQLNISQVSPSHYQQIDQALRSVIQQQVGSYLQPQTDHSLLVSDLDMYTHTPETGEQLLQLTGAAVPEVAPDLTFVQGRLPQSQTTTLEAAAPAAVASELHLTVGATIMLPLTLPSEPQAISLPIHIVGIFQTPPPQTTKPFLQENTLQITRSVGLSGISATFYPLLLAQDPLLTTLAQAPVRDALSQNGVTMTLKWVFHPDLRHIDIDHLGTIANTFTNLPRLINLEVATSAAQPYAVTSVLVGAASPLQLYVAQLQVAAVPIVILLLDIVGLLLFFITLIAELLIDGQSDTIAQLRSRGLSRAQLFGAYLVQSLGVGCGAFVLGLAIAVPVEVVLLPHFLPSSAPALTLTQGVSRGLLYALLISGFAIVTLWLSIITALQGDVLSARRETSRAARQPLWQRLYLDLALGLMLLVAFGLATYALQTSTDPQTVTLLMPLSLIAPTFLVVAGLLFLLRGLPWLFRQMAWLLARNRNAVPFLASLQLARTPQTILRLLLVFALTVAFTVYVFIFAASQDARIYDVAAQQVGADIVGITPPQSPATGTLAQITQRFRMLPDVTSATVGYEEFGNPLVVTNTSEINVIVLDTDTYAHTAVWPGQTDAQSTQHLMQQLSARRQAAIAADAVPALVNTSTWAAFHLVPGAHFRLNMSGYADNASMLFVAMAEVPTIPATETTEAGILVDYQTYSAVRQKDTELPPIVPSMIWLRLRDNTTSQSPLYAALNAPQTKMIDYHDRRTIDAQLHTDPLAALIIHLLTLGLVAPLVLAFIGNVLAIWTQMRTQVVLFALVRALGMVPAQVRNLLTWELGIMQALAVTLGCFFGWLLAVTLTPALVFTTTTPEQFNTPLAFYVLQTVLPVRIVVPPLVVGIIALLVGLTLGMIAIGVIGLRRLTISQTLRLNED